MDHGPIFSAMLEEFDGAARILDLEPGIWKILTTPKRQITVSCPVQMDNGEIEVFTGYRVQYNITLGPAKGGIRYHHGVTLDEVTGLVQDAIFSRPPKVGVRTGMFFGGKNPVLALDMLAAAKKAMVPPFGISLMADPAGSFTTAAAMVARVEHILKTKKNRTLEGLRVAIFGATGVVGFSAAVIAALSGAKVTLVGYDGIRRVGEAAREITARFAVDAHAADGRVALQLPSS